jgi:RimJ/RimL family protein N-acetyltransferase
MLEGILVDLVPYDKRFQDQDHRWCNSVSFFWSSAGVRTIVSRAEIEAQRREWLDDSTRTGVTFGILAKNGTPLGDIGINWISPHNRVANLGASIGEPEYWGGGYGTDALLLLIEYAFDALDIRKVWLGTMSINARVVRQMQKVGFALEGRRHDAVYADGQWHDQLVYGLLREEWPGYTALIAKIGLKPGAASSASPQA